MLLGVIQLANEVKMAPHKQIKYIYLLNELQYLERKPHQRQLVFMQVAYHDQIGI